MDWRADLGVRNRKGKKEGSSFLKAVGCALNTSGCSLWGAN